MKEDEMDGRNKKCIHNFDRKTYRENNILKTQLSMGG
jgi:hypothetical protein